MNPPKLNFKHDFASIARRRLLAALAAGPFAAAHARADVPPAAVYALVLDRLRIEYLSRGPSGDTSGWLRSMGGDGRWSDIDYDSRSVGAWPPMAHLDRLRALSVASQTPRSQLYRSTSVAQQVQVGLRFWLSRHPTSDNWWHNTIGQQLALAPILVLLKDGLPADVLGACVALLNVPAGIQPDRVTGQNLIWYANQQLIRGALTRSASDIATASQTLQSVLKISSDEGIQADYSFHQHGHQLYSGGYGLVFLQDGTRAAGLLNGTPWAFTAPSLEMLADYALQGLMPLIRGTWLDWGARGREVSRQERTPRPQLVRQSIADLAALAPTRRAELQEAERRLAGAVSSVQPYVRYFWRSDFLVQQTKDLYLSVKMCSERTVGTESGNGENLLGYWLPFGLTYLIRHGKEYEGIQPVWNWARLPGVTCPELVPPFTGYQRHPEAFVAGLTDEQIGVAAMHLNLPHVRGMKVWFTFNGHMVALGSGLESPTKQPLRTTLNQCRRSGAVVTDTGSVFGPGGTMSAKWVTHDSLVYRLLDGQAAQLKLETRRRVGDPTNESFGSASSQADVFELSIAHDTGKTAASYAYSVEATGAPQLGAPPASPVDVLANTPDLQAIYWPNAKRWAIVLHRAGSIKLSGSDYLTVDRPGVLIVRKTLTGYEFVFDTASAGPVSLALNRGGTSVSTAAVMVADIASRSPAYMSPRGKLLAS